MLAETIDLTDAWLRLLGRLHPILVHFPIALVISAACAEAVRAVRRAPGPSPFALTSVVIGASVALVAATSGWQNAFFEGVEAGPDLFIHRWTGVVTAGLLAVVAYCGVRGRSRPDSLEFGFWRVGLTLSALAVTGAGYFGGELAYGEGYIGKAFWSAMRMSTQADAEVAADAQTPAVVPVVEVAGVGEVAKVGETAQGEVSHSAGSQFVTEVLPVFESRCYECHSNKKSKGGLNLEVMATATEPDEQGRRAIDPGNVDASEMVRRIELPADNEDAMPADGARLTAAQIGAIRKWIGDGAPVAVSPGAVSGERRELPEQFLSAQQQCDVDLAVKALTDRGVLALPVSLESHAYEVNASLVRPKFSDADMPLMAGVCCAITNLNLARTQVGNDGLTCLSQMPRLVRLRLDRTQVGPGCAELLASLPKLEVLNLCGTAIDDRTLLGLAASRSLQRIFVWDTKVTDDAAIKFRLENPGVQVITGRE